MCKISLVPAAAKKRYAMAFNDFKADNVLKHTDTTALCAPSVVKFLDTTGDTVPDCCWVERSKEVVVKIDSMFPLSPGSTKRGDLI